MVATKERYKPKLVSEKLDRPLTLCRAAATGMAVFAMTLGESCTYPNGYTWGNVRIKQALKQARENTGEPNRPGYNQSHIPAFLKAFLSIRMEPSEYIFNKTRKRIRERLQTGHAITMAGDVAGTPLDSKLRRYVNPGVGHQLFFFDWQGEWKTGTVASIDPMTPPDATNYIRRIPVSEMWGFGRRFSMDTGDGRIYTAEKWRIGRNTEERQTARQLSALNLQLSNKYIGALNEISALDAENDELQAKLEECEQPPGVPLSQEEAAIAALEKALAELRS
jgi:hypothetical protein